MGAKPAVVKAGDRYGRLVVVEELAERDRAGSRVYLCRCDCGTDYSVRSGSLRTGKTRSCGCLSGKRFRGLRGHPLYTTWNAMVTRGQIEYVRRLKDAS